MMTSQQTPQQIPQLDPAVLQNATVSIQVMDLIHLLSALECLRKMGGVEITAFEVVGGVHRRCNAALQDVVKLLAAQTTSKSS